MKRLHRPDLFGWSEFNPDGAGMGSGSDSALADMEDIEDDPLIYEMPVELFGMIYLYNPVDMKRLGLDKKITAEEKVEMQNDAADAVDEPAVPGGVGVGVLPTPNAGGAPTNPAPGNPAPATPPANPGAGAKAPGGT